MEEDGEPEGFCQDKEIYQLKKEDGEPKGFCQDKEIY
jgi:hypothetical protein